MSTKSTSLLREGDNEITGTARPVVPRKADARVAQYAEKRGLDKKEAYLRVVNFLLDSEGNPRERRDD